MALLIPDEKGLLTKNCLLLFQKKEQSNIRDQQRHPALTEPHRIKSDRYLTLAKYFPRKNYYRVSRNLVEMNPSYGHTFLFDCLVQAGPL